MRTDQPVRSGGHRFAHVDALRAIAALLVVWAHTAESFDGAAGSGHWIHALASIFDVGRIGVVTFFLISGFVIPSSLDRPGSRAAVLREFLVRRFFRLYPAYWLSIPFAVLVMLAFDEPVRWQMVLANFTMIQEALGFTSAEGLYWTLQTELVFYGLCMLLFVAGVLDKNWVVLLVAVTFFALYLAQYLDLWTRYGSPALENPSATLLFAHLSLMLVGALLRRWYDGRLSSLAIRAGGVVLLAYWLVEPAFLQWHVPPFWITVPTFEISYTLAVALFLIGTFVWRIKAPFLVAIGRASYSLYLFHPVVFYALLRIVAVPRFHVLAGWNLGIYVLVAAGLSSILAIFIYRFVEKPMIARGVRLSRPKTALAKVSDTD